MASQSDASGEFAIHFHADSIQSSERRPRCVPINLAILLGSALPALQSWDARVEPPKSATRALPTQLRAPV